MHQSITSTQKVHVTLRNSVANSGIADMSMNMMKGTKHLERIATHRQTIDQLVQHVLGQPLFLGLLLFIQPIQSVHEVGLRDNSLQSALLLSDLLLVGGVGWRGMRSDGVGEVGWGVMRWVGVGWPG